MRYFVSLLVALLLACSPAVASAHFEMPKPFEDLVYKDCPQPIQWFSLPGRIVGGIAGGVLGGVVGLFAGEPLFGVYGGSVMGGNALGAVTGGVAWAPWRVFSGHACGQAPAIEALE